MKLLAIDTATENCSVALGSPQDMSVRSELLGRGHADRVLPMVQSLLAERGLTLTQLDAVAFGRGPGAFTGVRIGVSVVQGLALGADLPVVPVSDLAALALQALDRVPAVFVALACLDARMGEVYWGAYRRDQEALVVALGTERVVAPARLLETATEAAQAPWVGAGHGWRAYPELLRQWRDPAHSCLPDLLPGAAEILRLAVPDVAAGRVLDAAAAAPVYLRDEVAWVGARPGAA
jgi:tRNA threonylcarbamoyladenosine biosynthesis protein TsaB